MNSLACSILRDPACAVRRVPDQRRGNPHRARARVAERRPSTDYRESGTRDSPIHHRETLGTHCGLVGGARIPPDVRRRAEQRRQRDESDWPWLSPLTGSPTDYLDFGDYRKIIDDEGNWLRAFQASLKSRAIVVAKFMEPIQ